MTRKETLLLENYRLRNEYYTITGQTSKITSDLDSVVDTWQFKDEAKGETVYRLQNAIESLKRDIAWARKESERKAAADAYFATEEGQARKFALEQHKAELEDLMAKFMKQNEDYFKGWIKSYLGEHWTLRYLSDNRIEFAVIDPRDESKLVFGQTIEVYFEKHSWDGSERFETNIGTTGGFSILDSEQGDRARFYIDLGRFLSGKKELEEQRKMLFGYKECLDEMRQQRLDIEKELANPVSL